MATKDITASEVNEQMIADWKKKFDGVFKYETEDGKVGYFRMPDRKILGMSTTAPDNVAGNEIIANNCFLAGDRIILEDDKYFFGLSKELPKYIKIQTGKSTEL
ncbi:MAG TPA: hypothetical protein PK431_01690 [Chitinophagales bacterium]|nr:hypothetical protein [Chitinophagales bacterium]